MGLCQDQQGPTSGDSPRKDRRTLPSDRGVPIQGLAFRYFTRYFLNIVPRLKMLVADGTFLNLHPCGDEFTLRVWVDGTLLVRCFCAHRTTPVPESAARTTFCHLRGVRCLRGDLVCSVFSVGRTALSLQAPSR